MGKLWIYSSLNKVDEWRDAAQGAVTIPPGKKMGLTVSDDAIFDLSPLGSLRPDDLHGLLIWPTKVNLLDAGLVQLQNLRALESVNLSDTDVSHAAITSLQKALPNCRIITDRTEQREEGKE